MLKARSLLQHRCLDAAELERQAETSERSGAQGLTMERKRLSSGIVK